MAPQLVPGPAGVRLGGLLDFGVGWLVWSTLTTGMLAGWLIAAIVLRRRHVATQAFRAASIPLGPCLCYGALLAVVVH